jgi:vacuolar-type H+-ATPase subunit E/Vma4
MSLESILEHIVNESGFQQEKIIQAARHEAARIVQGARAEAEGLYKDIYEQERVVFENQKQKQLVNARLEHKKSLLLAKQGLMDRAFKKLKSILKAERFKKEQVLADRVKEAPENIDFYLARFRQEHETEIAGILFK